MKFRKRPSALHAMRQGVNLRAVRDTDPIVLVLVSVTLGLVAFGVIMVMSASSVSSYLANRGPWGAGFRQAGYALVAVVAMAAASFIKPKRYMQFAAVLYFFGLILQGLVFSPLGFEVWGNRNWLRVGPVQIQPSEFLKLALILMLAAVIQRMGQNRTPIQELFPVVIFSGLALGLIMAGRDLGTASIVGLAIVGVLLFGELSGKAIALFCGGAVLAAVLFVVSSPNRMARIMSRFSDSGSYSGLDWQPIHGMWALANGGIFGNGLGSSKAKWSWLPAAENDYIFAIIGEETGLIGALCVIAAYVVLAWAMLQVIQRSQTRFQKAVVGGVLAWIIGQALVNIGVVIRIFPVLGVPLPLLSAGGTALIACCLAMGVVISIARETAANASELPVAQNNIHASE